MNQLKINGSDDIITIDGEEKENINKAGLIRRNNVKEKTPTNEKQPFIDLKGNVWNYLGPGGFVERHYPLLGLKMCTETKRWAVLFCSQRFDLKCPYQMLLIKKKGLIYQRFEHSHQVTKSPEELLKGKTPSPKKDGEDGRASHEMELAGWKLIVEGVHSEEQLKEHRKQNQVIKSKQTDGLICRFKCRYPRCGYKMRWIKRLGEIWAWGNHNRNHPSRKKKKRRLAL